MNQNSSIRMQVLCALFAAVTAVCSQITIPIQPVPITLGTFAVLMAGGFLGKRYGFLAIAIYLLLGMAGVPVFSMMRGGVAVLAGPGGGFIMTYPFMAFLVGFVAEKMGGFNFKHMIVASLCANVLCYSVGIGWFMFLTGTGIWPSLVMCMFPFLPGDLAKLLLASFLVSKYRRRLVGNY
ncbi:biotin transporter BioY [uncultured Dialister sp.]|uniref:biotin transporter BioY n=1 Tax=uncultured Dialister sp. TaxID=278064 RepID=UPI00265DA63B|nr:biotin transporter BioY [uncultured Dialister sp.]